MTLPNRLSDNFYVLIYSLVWIGNTLVASGPVPPPPLVVRFGPCERRIWRDVVSAFAQQHP